MIDSNAERARIVERHATYIRERMQLPISDRQYLWWDHIFLEKMPEVASVKVV